MPSKTVSLEEGAYHLLANARRDGESFSQVVRRLLQTPRPQLADLATLLPRQSVDALKKDIAAMRTADADLADDRSRRHKWP